MKELKILIVLVFFTGIVYWGVEPFAHSQMHPHVAPADFNFAKGAKEYENEMVKKAQESLDDIKDTKSKEYKMAKLTLDNTRQKADAIKAFWSEVEKIDLSKGDATQGATTFMNAGCIGCHGLKSQGMPSPMDDASASASFGVVPPDLSTAGYLYDPRFLAALIKKPNMALHLEEKFNDAHPFPMTDFYGAGGANINQEIADIVAYLVSIAPKKLSDKETFVNACQRCHDVRYDKLVANTEKTALKKYMGSNPPDLSIIVRARSLDYLKTFINDPQKELHGTSMPRVGLNEKAQEQVVSYLESVGDSKKAQREDLGLKIMGYFVLLSLFAVLWKFFIWRRVH